MLFFMTILYKLTRKAYYYYFLSLNWRDNVFLRFKIQIFIIDYSSYYSKKSTLIFYNILHIN